MKEKKKIDNFEEFVVEEVLRDVAQIDADVAEYKKHHNFQFPAPLQRNPNLPESDYLLIRSVFSEYP